MNGCKIITSLTFFLLTFLFSRSQTIDSNRVTIDTTEVGRNEAFKKFYSGDFKPNGWITDWEFLFTDSEKLQLDSIILKFEKETTIQIAIVVVDTIQLRTKDKFDEFALFLANNWGVGQKGKDNGILVAISSRYRRIRICNGYGIEKCLSDSETKLIIDEDFIPYFKKGKYFDGTLNGLNKLINILRIKCK
jgi:uncharacterized protein